MILLKDKRLVDIAIIAADATMSLAPVLRRAQKFNEWSFLVKLWEVPWLREEEAPGLLKRVQGTSYAVADVCRGSLCIRFARAAHASSATRASHAAHDSVGAKTAPSQRVEVACLRGAAFGR